eukprot:gene22353-29447_t
MYFIEEPHGDSYIAINTETEKPTIEFRSSRRAFNAIYERWCISNELKFREVLDEQKFLKNLCITMQKRVHALVLDEQKFLKDLRITMQKRVHTLVLDEQKFLKDLRITMQKRVHTLVKGTKQKRSDLASALVQEDIRGETERAIDAILAKRTPPMSEAGSGEMEEGDHDVLDATWPRSSTGAGPMDGEAGDSLGRDIKLVASSLQLKKRKGKACQKLVAQIRAKDGGPSLALAAAAMADEKDAANSKDKDSAKESHSKSTETSKEDGKGKKEGEKKEKTAEKDTKAEKAALAAAMAEKEEQDKKKKLFDTLMSCPDPLAMFLRSESEPTANFANDSWGIGIMTHSYRNWLKIQALQDELENMQEHERQIVDGRLAHATAIEDAREAANKAIDHCEALEQAAKEATENTDQDPTKNPPNISIRGLAFIPCNNLVKLTPEEIQKRSAAAALAKAQADAQAMGELAVLLAAEEFIEPPPPPPTEVMKLAQNLDAVIITPAEVEAFGLKYLEEDSYDLYGVLVNLKDLQDSPKDSNRIIWLWIDVLNVIIHAVFIWALGAPLLFVCIQYNNVYGATTAVEHLLTLNNFRQDPRLFNELYFETFLRNLLFIAISCILF